jgi:copper chaperone CopZ
VHLAGWPPEGQGAVETRLRQVPGVLSVQVNPLTGNVLVHFNSTATDEQAIVAAVQTLKPDSMSLRSERLTVAPVAPNHHTRSGSTPGGMPGLAGDPDVARPVSLLQDGRPRLLNLDIVDLILKGVCAAVSLVLADSPLGLLVGAVEVLRLVLKIAARQTTWHGDTVLGSIAQGRTVRCA